MRHFRWFPLLVLVSYLISGCSSAATPAPVLQTVVHTLAVEVTRNVEVTRLVEMTREVAVIQVIELPVTITPSLPEATPTVQVQSQPATPPINSTPQATPQEKYTGYTPIFVQNKTNDKMAVYLAGPDEFNLVLWGGDQQKIWAREGGYSYTVWINDQEAYHGKFKIVSEDKYYLILNESKAILWIP